MNPKQMKREILKPHFGLIATWTIGAVYQPLLSGAVVVGVLWYALLWMYHRKIFVRV